MRTGCEFCGGVLGHARTCQNFQEARINEPDGVSTTHLLEITRLLLALRADPTMTAEERLHDLAQAGAMADKLLDDLASQSL